MFNHALCISKWCCCILLIIFCLEVVIQRCSVKKVFLDFSQNPRKIPVPESLLPGYLFLQNTFLGCFYLLLLFPRTITSGLTDVYLFIYLLSFSYYNWICLVNRKLKKYALCQRKPAVLFPLIYKETIQATLNR